MRALSISRTMLTATFVALLLAVAAAADAEVKATIDQITFPVKHSNRERPNYAPINARKLRGKSEYTTKRVRLENDYLIVDILPEFAGRVHRIRYKSGPLMPRHDEPIDLFWHQDHLPDKVPWAFGAGRFSFPFYEHGRHLDETAGYTIIDLPDGGKMVAMDTRFQPFLKPAETKRYGRATPLRLGHYVTLRPHESKVRWEAVVSNPMPMRVGMKLWHLLRQRNVPDAQLLVPSATMTGHGAPNIADWQFPHNVTQDSKFSYFSVGHQHDFAGWYFPSENLNVVRIADHQATPGTKVVSYPPGTASYNEIWTGSHIIFEGPGRMLPAFGGYRMTLDIFPIAGIGRIDYAAAHGAINARRGPGGWRVNLLPTQPITNGRIRITSGSKHYEQSINVTPHQPAVIDTPLTGDRISVQLRDNAGNTLLQAELPLDPGAKREEAFADLKQLMRGEGPGGRGLLEEAHGLVAEHGPSMWKARGRYAKLLIESNDTTELLHTARRLLQMNPESTAIETGLAKVLKKHPDDPHANLYRAIWLLEHDRPDDARPHLVKAASLPGGAFLLALDRMRSGDTEAADKLLQQVLAAKVADTFTASGDDNIQPMLQPGAFVANYEPAAYRAVLLRDQRNITELTRTLRLLPTHIIEGWLLLGEKDRLATFRERNPAGYRQAERTLRAAGEGRWLGVPHPRN